jgi:hypothetical protein
MSYNSSLERYLSVLSEYFRRPVIYIACISALMIWGFFNIKYADPDLFARVAVGKLIANSGEVPQVDPFAFTAKKALWIDHEWLSGLIFYRLSQSAGGDWTLFFAKILFAVLTLLIVYKAMQSASKVVLNSAAFWLLFFAIKCSYVWISTIRSQVFTYLFFALLIYFLLEADRKNKKFVLLLLPLIFLFWGNLHGGFVSGLGIFLMFIAGKTLDDRAIAWPFIFSFLLSLLAPCLNPYGVLPYWSYIIEAVSMPRPEIPEWAPLGLTSPVALGVHAFLIFLVVGIYQARRDLRFSALLPLLASGYFAYKHERFVALFVITGVTLGLPYLDQTVSLIKKTLPRWFDLGVIVGGSLLIVGAPFFYLPFIKFLCDPRAFKLDYSEYPVGACEWLGRHGGGRLLVDFSNGSFALWRLYPKYQISLDGRYEELYTDETAYLVTSALAFRGEESRKALLKINPDVILYYTDILSDKNIKTFLPGWEKVYSDALYTVAAKNFSSEDLSDSARSFDMWRARF